LTLTCDQNSFSGFGFGWNDDLAVEDNQFSYERIDPRNGGAYFTTRVRGEVRNKDTRANGTARVVGEVPYYGLTNCDTGTLHWTASFG
jgi:hypothetical protein